MLSPSLNIQSVEEVAELWEPWMQVVDQLLEDDELLEAVYRAQGKRHRRSRTRGRRQTPAEVALRMLIPKHLRNWSDEMVAREVRANVVYRRFCRIGLAKVPDEKTLLRLGQAIGPGSAASHANVTCTLAQERLGAVPVNYEDEVFVSSGAAPSVQAREAL